MPRTGLPRLVPIRAADGNRPLTERLIPRLCTRNDGLAARGQVSDLWLGLSNAIAAGMMLSASFSLMEEGVSLEADGCADEGRGEIGDAARNEPRNEEGGD
jgi:hypothetical protein